MKASSFCTNIRMKQRIIFLSFLFIFLFLYAIKISNVNSKAASYYHLNSLKSEEECILEQRQQQEKLFFLDDTNNNNNDKKRRAVKYLDLNEEQQQQQHILLLTTLTTLNDNIDTYLTNYFDLIDQSTYPNKLITLSFLLTQQKDAESLESLLKAKVQQYQYGRWNNQFFQINIVQKDFTDMSRAKNFLLSTSLREYHSWVFWLDFNQLYSFPKTIFHDLISLDEDVIVPNCLLLSQDSYDSTSNWQESDLSLLKQQNIPENQILTLDDDYSSDRQLLTDMPTHLGMNYRVPLDGVGGPFIMVRSAVHRQGAIFPPFVYQHQIDTEGFAKMVKSMGFTVYGIPGYTILLQNKAKYSQ